VFSRGESQHVLRLQSITDAALAHLELEELLAVLLHRIRALLDADTCAILLLDEPSGELVARAAVGLEEAVERGFRIPVGQGFAGRVVAERRPILLPDVDHADVLNPLLREKGIKTLLGAPLLVEGRPIGVVHIGTLTYRAFGQDEIDLLQLVADRVAIAIDHARVYGAERSARERLERVQAVTDAALAHLDLNALLAELLPKIRAMLDVHTTAILLLDAPSNELVARAAVGLEEEVEQGTRIPVGGGFAGRVAAERRAIALDDVDHADVLNPLLRQKGIKSLLGVPLVVRDEVIGVLHVGTLVPRSFTEGDTQLLQLVADRVALAIERAQLHEAIVALDEMKLNFVAVASHELRTPAASVYGLLTTLRARGDTLSPELRDQLEETAWQQSDRMRRLIEQLLDLSRLDARSVSIERQTVQLRTLLAELSGDAADVQLDVDPALSVDADPLVLDRVITNLLGNARSYGKPPIRIGAEAGERYVRIWVTDEGGGVPADLVPRLFDRFERGELGQGTGLGLSIARAYATAHGGDLLYQPSAAGARFELLLPRGR
jgi:signal transduction histidine kinase